MMEYPHVTIYTTHNRARNRFYEWNTITVPVEDKNAPYRIQQRSKDRRMCEDCDRALVIWDGRSQGSKSNIVFLKEKNKPVIIR